MMVVGAFYQVQQALRWYVERFPVIAEWRAMLSRIMGYRDALTGFETLGEGESLIRYAPHEDGKLAIGDLCVSSPAGRIMLSEQHVEIAPGDHVLIAGSARSGKSVFFRAIAGLWIWGTGSVRLPPRESMMFLPQIPYVPLGTLRAALTYPAPPDRFSDAEVQAAMERVWLERFIPALDEAGRWDKQLSPDEQHRLVLGRVLLHRPAWVIQDESVMEMDEGSKRLAESIFSEELAGAAVVSFGRDDESNHFYQRVYKLRATAPKLVLPLRFPGDGPAPGVAE
jgi:putative ATP-binding cassette transporter